MTKDVIYGEIDQLKKNILMISHIIIQFIQ
jgi:hypothetical protein